MNKKQSPLAILYIYIYIALQLALYSMLMDMGHYLEGKLNLLSFICNVTIYEHLQATERERDLQLFGMACKNGKGGGGQIE